LIYGCLDPRHAHRIRAHTLPPVAYRDKGDAYITRVTDLKLAGGKEPVTVANTIVGPHRGGGAMQANGTVELTDTPDGSDAHVAVHIRLAGEGDTDSGPEFSATIPDGGTLSVPAGIQTDATPPGSYDMELDVRSDSPVTAGSRVLNVAVLPSG
jgi:hypothetical protein